MKNLAVMIGTRDLERARAFYDLVLGIAGLTRLVDTDEMTAWAVKPEEPWFCVTLPYNGEPAEPGNGMQASLILESSKQVIEMHAAALANGGQDVGAPGLRETPVRPPFFGAYFRDPDGNKVGLFNLQPDLG